MFFHTVHTLQISNFTVDDGVNQRKNNMHFIKQISYISYISSSPLQNTFASKNLLPFLCLSLCNFCPGHRLHRRPGGGRHTHRRMPCPLYLSFSRCIRACTLWSRSGSGSCTGGGGLSWARLEARPGEGCRPSLAPAPSLAQEAAAPCKERPK